MNFYLSSPDKTYYVASNGAIATTSPYLKPMLFATSDEAYVYSQGFPDALQVCHWAQEPVTA